MAATISGLRRRLAREESGFTLVELLVVLVIIGILLAVAVPSYLGFKDRAKQGAAQANVRTAVPAVEAYFADTGHYSNMALTTGDAPDTGGLTGIDAGVTVTVVSAGASTYCISDTQGTFTFYKNGPAGDITTVACT
jgi:type IV pilus assembly protein PilA